MHKSEYVSKLQALNFPEVGKGLYANVFAIPNTDKVMKVASIDAWPVYIKWASENGHMGKFAPKVDSLKFFDGFYVAVMEKLVATINDMPYNATPKRIYHSAIRDRDDSDGGEDLVAYVKELRAAHLADDMHDGNVMIRKDGQIVITDPTSGDHATERFKIKSGKTLSP